MMEEKRVLAWSSLHKLKVEIHFPTRPEIERVCAWMKRILIQADDADKMRKQARKLKNEQDKFDSLVNENVRELEAMSSFWLAIQAINDQNKKEGTYDHIDVVRDHDDSYRSRLTCLQGQASRQDASANDGNSSGDH